MFNQIAFINECAEFAIDFINEYNLDDDFHIFEAKIAIKNYYIDIIQNSYNIEDHKNIIQFYNYSLDPSKNDNDADYYIDIAIKIIEKHLSTKILEKYCDIYYSNYDSDTDTIINE